MTENETDGQRRKERETDGQTDSGRRTDRRDGKRDGQRLASRKSEIDRNTDQPIADVSLAYPSGASSMNMTQWRH